MKKHDSDFKKIVFAGGGTGGHIYPGLAVCDAFRKLCEEQGKSVQICWIGNSRGMDRNIVSKNVDSSGRQSADVFYGIPSGKLQSNSLQAVILDTDLKRQLATGIGRQEEVVVICICQRFILQHFKLYGEDRI